METELTQKQQASLDRAWAKRTEAGTATKAAKAAWLASGGIDTAQGNVLYRAYKAAEANERKARGVWFRLQTIYRKW